MKLKYAALDRKEEGVAEMDIVAMCAVRKGKVHISARQRMCSFTLRNVWISRSLTIMY